MSQIYTGVPDGKEVRLEGNPAVDAVSMTRINARTLDTAALKEGEVVTYATRVLSEDGRVMEITMSGKNTEGRPYHNLAIYEKRGP